jgi:anti-sigma B factor antagonist
MSFEARTERLGTMTVVVLAGELDIAAEAGATAALTDAIGDGGVLVADLRELTFLDSTGVRVLLTADLHAKERGVRFGVARSDGMVRRLLEVTRIEERFPVVDDPAELAEPSAAQ